jgi:hypothetical protein
MISRGCPQTNAAPEIGAPFFNEPLTRTLRAVTPVSPLS